MAKEMADGVCERCGKGFRYYTKATRGRFCSRNCAYSSATQLVTEAHEKHRDNWGRVTREQILNAWEQLKSGEFVTITDMLRSLGYDGRGTPLRLTNTIPAAEYEKVLLQTQTRRWPREVVWYWFNQWIASNRSLKEFKCDGMPHYATVAKLFRNYFPSQYEDAVEEKGAKWYQIGRRFEYRCRDALTQYGYVVVRSAQSRGAADLVALRLGEILLVQCKTRKDSLKRDEREKLLNMAKDSGGVAVLAYRGRKGEGIHWELLDGTPIQIS